MKFEELDLDARLLRAVEACGFETPTPIQQEAIPKVLGGGDLMASAQTGTGKTAAFVLPILHRLLAQKSRLPGKGPRCLVLAPTRELALQVEKDTQSFSKFTKIKWGSLLGGVAYGPQITLLKNPVDFLIATPGRLLDHIQQGRLDFGRLEYFVLDEADRMLDMGFIGDIRRVVALLPKKRQTLLFSATLEGAVLRMANSILTEPDSIQLTHNRLRHDQIEESILRADDATHKNALLVKLLSEGDFKQALIFTATKRGADMLANRLSREGLQASVLHGDMKQSARKRTIDEMHAGKARLLVATDVAARGLDFKEVSHVINYDLPNDAEDYIHRIGRTGRAEAHGKAVSLVTPQDWEYLLSIERVTGKKLKRDVIPGLEPSSKEPKMKLGLGTGRTWRPRRGGSLRRRMAAARS